MANDGTMKNLYAQLSLTAACLLFGLLTARGQTLSGQVRTETNQGIEDANVTVTGPGVSLATLTNSMGNFSFSGFTNGQTYTLCVTLEQNPLNGVSSFDLQLLTQHLLQNPPLSSPYKIIAGQTDPSYEAPDVGDVLRIQKLIQGEFTQLTVPSWKFIPANYSFPDPAHPYSAVPPFPNGCKTVIVNGNTPAQDFIGVKTGDFNNTAVPH